MVDIQHFISSHRYLGNETQEKELVSVLNEAMKSKPELKMNWILDGVFNQH